MRAQAAPRGGAQDRGSPAIRYAAYRRTTIQMRLWNSMSRTAARHRLNSTDAKSIRFGSLHVRFDQWTKNHLSNGDK
jgi:hypothetical protein